VRFSGIDASELISGITIYRGDSLRQAEHSGCTLRVER
jgi:hypothetical protein